MDLHEASAVDDDGVAAASAPEILNEAGSSRKRKKTLSVNWPLYQCYFKNLVQTAPGTRASSET